ncbi:hypothetical protein A1Q1_02258 [Trichosporon asahii var. asahii CBS 2479]|uniref:BZIP domain-containing protein n=1 Tax=Trichosporon asahii var. asahii (strain ATCC 90039 / CBS 2479 / JCM 2466 / KCTC 7840 / NBRC 103889/ NCYC 2677 / UAMH 7654) TaxID=1186058 RepID=J5QRF1_TRIAS|nr:hypothetical protein A1Q1_02258 [Trichosporon asahii var. asahii CBS 2479]EJT48713.1 hypothetical protein A1Q1_02258 [Trichosporon asahii var. asahii CBS 2479]
MASSTVPPALPTLRVTSTEYTTQSTPQSHATPVPTGSNTATIQPKDLYDLPLSSAASSSNKPTETPTPSNNNNTFSMLDELFTSTAPFDWDQFLVGDPEKVAVPENEASPASAILNLSSPAGTPASAGDSPQSTESEQSRSLDGPSGIDLLDFDLDLPAPTGIAHDPRDILATLQASAPPAVPDATLNSDAFGSAFSGFGGLASLDQQRQPRGSCHACHSRSATPAAPAGLPEAYAALGWPASTPAAGAAPAMKRKVSDVSDDGSVSSKRPRGRPASTAPPAKRPYRRQSKPGLSLSQLAAAAASGSPVVVGDKKEPLPQSPSPALEEKPAVVPEKYMKNGEAQAITGMSTEQILSFPNWAALMECVDDAHRAGAEVFGKMITENRDKAKWAAKKSRDERKAKVETLEGQVDELQGKIAEMRGLLLSLVGRGAVSLADVEAYI